MNVLIACEESQRVCIEFRRRGHRAFSCDLMPPSGGHPEWHIMGDCLPLINGNCTFTTMDATEHTISDKWDLIIAHPPCTYFSVAGANWLFRGGKLNTDRYARGLEMKKLFMAIYDADCPHIAIENPTPLKIWELPIATQVIQPWQFGDPYKKRTCLWLKNLPELAHTNIVTPIASWVNGGSHGKNVGLKSSAKERSKTFPGIAVAMAEQWGGQI